MKNSTKSSKAFPSKKLETIKKEVARFRDIKMQYPQLKDKLIGIKPKENSFSLPLRNKNEKQLSNLLSPNTFKSLCQIKNDTILETHVSEGLNVRLILMTLISKELDENRNSLAEEIKRQKLIYEEEIRKREIIIEEYKKEVRLYKRLIENQARENEFLKKELHQTSFEGFKAPDSNISNPLILITNE